MFMSRSMTTVLAIFFFTLLVMLSLSVGPSGIDTTLLNGLPFLETTNRPMTSEIVTWLLLPRTVMALICGAALGAAGVLIQAATRNPFASPATLGINAGAMLATVLAMVIVPGITGQLQVAVAFSGAALTAWLVFKLAQAISSSPVNLVLVGMAITLSLGALSAGLLIFWENRLDGLYTWGAGNLAQFDYQAVSLSWPVVTVMIVMGLLFARRLDLIELGNEQAASLGIDVRKTVGLSLFVALVLSSTVVSQVGMISFVGLIAPHIARGLGFRPAWLRLLVAAIIGALLLLAADVLARTIPFLISEAHYSIPAGAMTTVVGAPCMIFLLCQRRRISSLAEVPKETGIKALFRWSPVWVIFSLVCLLGLTLFYSLFSQLDMSWFHLRWPRVLTAALAGAALAVSGLVLQTLMRNPLASPDVSGLTTTGVLFVVVVTVLFPGIERLDMTLLSILGSGFALVLLLILNCITGFNPQLFALSGLCLASISATLISVVLVLGSNQSSEVLLWLSGSTYAASRELTYLLFVCLVVMFPLLMLMWRRLDILQLGECWPVLLGIRVRFSVCLLLLLVALLSAVSVATVGGISFIGLMAPHICRVTGLSSHRHLLPATALTGAVLLVISDWLSRTLLSPFEIPAGLLVSGAGGLYFILLLMTGKYVQSR